MKFKATVFFSLLVCMASSCLNTDDIVYEEDANAGNAQILTLSLAHDSVPELAKAKFSIDQITGEVYNHDSLPYDTDLSKLYPFADSIRVKVTYTTVYSYAAMRAEVDTLTWIASGDSLTVLPNIPIQFNIYAAYGAKKEYKLSVNVHKIDPDSVQYQVFTGEVPTVSPPPTFVLPESPRCRCRQYRRG
ncbi:hypothetical protein AGMMS4957_10250 [Bacteroidia bacterium]|nr:hypothetical protein AGMMS4957_10250 [Bacteroidia bacterium]